MSEVTIANSGPGAHRPFNYTPLEDPEGREKLTNTEAVRLVNEIHAWAAQFKHESSDAFMLCDAMRDMDRLLARVGTEIDESLTRLMLLKAQPTSAEEHLQIARKYLNRWQDRGGRCGNANLPARV